MPRAIWAATGVAFFIYVFMAWAMVVGMHGSASRLAGAAFPFVGATIAASSPLQYLLCFAGFTSAMGVLFGTGNAFDYTATLATDLSMVVFIVTNIATIPDFWTRHRDEFSWLRHAAVPIPGVIAFGYPLYESVLPSQAAPYNWFGIAILVAYGISFLSGLAGTHRIGDMGQRLADDVVEEALPGAA